MSGLTSVHFTDKQHAIGVTLPQLGHHGERVVSREVYFLQGDHIHELIRDCAQVVVLELKNMTSKLCIR